MNCKFIEGTLIDRTNNKEVYKITDIDGSSIFSNEISADEKPKFNLNHIASIQCETTYINSDLLNSMAESYQKCFNAKFDLPIDIQKRYHKKKRINKKWVKRYGFVEDVVHCKSPVDMMKTTPSDSGIVAEIDMEFSKLEMNLPTKITNNHKLVWRFK